MRIKWNEIYEVKGWRWDVNLTTYKLTGQVVACKEHSMKWDKPGFETRLCIYQLYDLASLLISLTGFLIGKMVTRTLIINNGHEDSMGECKWKQTCVHAFHTYFWSMWEYSMISPHSAVWGKVAEYFRTSAQESLLLTLRRWWKHLANRSFHSLQIFKTCTTSIQTSCKRFSPLRSTYPLPRGTPPPWPVPSFLLRLLRLPCPSKA